MAAQHVTPSDPQAAPNRSGVGSLHGIDDHVDAASPGQFAQTLRHALGRSVDDVSGADHPTVSRLVDGIGAAHDRNHFCADSSGQLDAGRAETTAGSSDGDDLACDDPAPTCTAEERAPDTCPWPWSHRVGGQCCHRDVDDHPVVMGDRR